MIIEREGIVERSRQDPKRTKGYKKVCYPKCHSALLNWSLRLHILSYYLASSFISSMWITIFINIIYRIYLSSKSLFHLLSKCQQTMWRTLVTYKKMRLPPSSSLPSLAAADTTLTINCQYCVFLFAITDEYHGIKIETGLDNTYTFILCIAFFSAFDLPRWRAKLSRKK